MAYNFPANPTNGDTYQGYTYDGTIGAWTIPATSGGGTAVVTVSETAPENPSDGNEWYDITDGRSYIYVEDVDSAQWVEKSAIAVLPQETVTQIETNTADIASLESLVALLLPAGTIMQTAAVAAPTGYLMCDGSIISRSTYSALFNAIGTTYGAGNGSTTFAIPDLRGKVAVGKDSGTFSTLGATGGEETHVLGKNEMPSHDHTVPNHSHTFSGTTSTNGNHNHSASVGVTGADDNNHTGNGDYVADSDAGYRTQRGVSVGYAGDHSHTYSGTTSATGLITDSTGSGAAHNNLQPYVVLNYMIKI